MGTTSPNGTRNGSITVLRPNNLQKIAESLGTVSGQIGMQTEYVNLLCFDFIQRFIGDACDGFAISLRDLMVFAKGSISNILGESS